MILKDLHTSLTRMLDSFRQTQFSENGFDLEVVDFDTHADNSTLPDKDVVGLAGFSVETDGFTYLTILLGVSTYKDFNLVRHREIMSALYESVKPLSSHRVYDTRTGAVKGYMKVDGGIKLMPVSENKARPLQFVAVLFATDSFITP